MHSGIVGTSIIHNLSLAVAYGGPIFAKVGLYKAVMEGEKDPKERGKVVAKAWEHFTPVNLAAHVAFTGTWLIERRAIKRYFADKRTTRLVNLKDILIGGALVAGVANVAVGRMMKRDFPEGLSLPLSTTHLPADRAMKLQRYITYYRVMGPVHQALLGASIATGPVLVTSIIRHTARSLLSRLFVR
jgi:hypothetical protein